MKIIQLILIPSFALLTVLYFRRFRSLLLDRMIVLGIGAVGILTVLFPQTTVAVAHLFGVGRGTDLVMYLGLTGLSFVCIILFSKVRTLEARLTEVARTRIKTSLSLGMGFSISVN